MYSRTLALVMLPSFWYAIFEATIPFLVTLIYESIRVIDNLQGAVYNEMAEGIANVPER